MLQLLSVIGYIRDRAMILVLLRTGMRNRELLDTKVTDINLGARRIEIYEEKNRLIRVVYLSDDAVSTHTAWFKGKDCGKEYLTAKVETECVIALPLRYLINTLKKRD